MTIIFYIAALVAFFSTVMVVTRKNAVHALLYLIVSLLAVSVIFFISGAPFVAALEVIVYAGAILVLFVFAIMMLNLGVNSGKEESKLLKPNAWIIPTMLSLILLGELVYVFFSYEGALGTLRTVGPQEVSESLFGGYMLAVELTGMLLMAGVVGAYHIGKEKKREYHRYLQPNENS
ncbi:MAG TPA: NADH-quinone oxidoreductase subunit J [Ginsengibacter sp.]|nr:NADH-quinone oxidoreductase subunit J [Ginsengibacter sp.]HRP16639.1 NADH-quinone oxidoreductase subunit J [Ginsengibacter sp.]HRP43754.1 NADH-quinone oxidoreductase subunit J [Ginsengibacter sp.]